MRCPHARTVNRIHPTKRLRHRILWSAAHTGKKSFVVTRYTAKGKRRSHHSSLQANGSDTRISSTINNCFPAVMKTSMTEPPHIVGFYRLFSIYIILFLINIVNFLQEYEVICYRNQNSEGGAQAPGDDLFWIVRTAVFLFGSSCGIICVCLPVP